MIDRSQLRYFLAVVDQGNFSRAAQHCHVAQPTLSIGIAKLEREIGQALFLRNSQRVELTPAGSRLLLHARRIEGEFNLAARAITGVGRPAVFRLGILRSIPAANIAGCMLAIREMAPDALVELVEGNERDLIGHLTKGRIDTALTVVGRGNGKFPEERLFEEGYALALAADHPAANVQNLSAETLGEEVMILRRHCEALPEINRHFTERGIRPHFAYRSTNDERVLEMVAAGLGITVMPDCYEHPGVLRRGLPELQARRAIGLMHCPGTEHLPEGHKLAVDLLRIAIRSRGSVKPNAPVGQEAALVS